MAESTFQTDVLRNRLRNLNSSQNSIQTMSLWISHHHESSEKIAKIWSNELVSNAKGSADWILAMFYVVNDAVQNSRKNRTPSIPRNFFAMMKPALVYVGKNKDKWPEKVFNSINRVLNILGERGVYNSKEIDELQAALHGRPQKRKRGEHEVALANYKTNIEERMKIRTKAFNETLTSIKTLMNPPSADSQTRNMIAKLPEALADPKNVNPKSIAEARHLLQKTTDAHNVVDSFAKKVKEERDQTKELHKHLQFMGSILAVEARLDKDLLNKANSCLDQLKAKKAKLEHQRELLPDEPKPKTTLDILPEEIEHLL